MLSRIGVLGQTLPEFIQFHARGGKDVAGIAEILSNQICSTAKLVAANLNRKEVPLFEKFSAQWTKNSGSEKGVSCTSTDLGKRDIQEMIIGLNMFTQSLLINSEIQLDEESVKRINTALESTKEAIKNLESIGNSGFELALEYIEVNRKILVTMLETQQYCYRTMLSMFGVKEA